MPASPPARPRRRFPCAGCAAPTGRPRPQPDAGKSRCHGLRNFRWTQAAFGADQQRHRSRRRFQSAQTLLGQWIEQQAQTRCRRLPQPRRQRERRAHFRQSVAPALLARADGDSAPVLHLAVQPFAAQSGPAAFGEQRLDGGDAQFDGFLQGVIHLLATRDALRQNDAQRRFHLAGQRFRNPRQSLPLADVRQGRRERPACAVEQQQWRAGLEP